MGSGPSARLLYRLNVPGRQIGVGEQPIPFSRLSGVLGRDKDTLVTWISPAPQQKLDHPHTISLDVNDTNRLRGITRNKGIELALPAWPQHQPHVSDS
jgi:hypothetical protein